MSKVHIIKEGETLSELAKLYNTDEATLQKLNADQIKNIDVIYAGGTLNLPDDSKIASWNALDNKPENNLSTKNITKSPCSKTTFVDVLYVPSFFGKQGKSEQQFLFLTEEAKKAVDEEYSLCSSAVNQKDKTARVQALGALGLMDAFNSYAHEAFLSSKEKKYYQDAIAQKVSLEEQLVRSPDIINLPGDYPQIGVSGAQDDAKSLEDKYERRLEKLKKYYSDIYGDDFLQKKAWADYYEQAKAHYSEQRDKELKSLQKDLCEDISRKIAYYEKKAKQTAKETKLPQGELTYNFTDRGYYSSNTSAATYELIKSLLSARAEAKLGIQYDIKADKTSHDILSLDQAEKFYSLWKDDQETIADCLSSHDLTAIRILRKGFNYEQLAREFTKRGVNFAHPQAAILGLNLLSVAVKEQCLSKRELFNGKDGVNQAREIFEEKTSDLRRIKRLLSDITIEELGFYPAYVLQLLILKDVATRVQEFTDIVGSKNENYVKLVKSILPYAQRCGARIEALRSVAEENKSKPERFSQLKGALFDGKEISAAPIQLIWDEVSYRPEDLSDHLFASSDKDKCHIVECSLASDYQSHVYLRSNCAVLSTDSKVHKNHVKRYTVSSSGTSLKTNESITRKLGEKWSANSSVEWQEKGPLADVDDIACFPWIKEKSDILGIEGAYDWSASAQFMRYVSSAKASASAELGAAKGGSDFGMTLVAASGKSEMKATFPANGDKKVLLPYISRTDGSKPKVRDIGSFIVEVTGTVYGAIAASMTLSDKLQVGNTPTGQFGVRGVMPTTTEFTTEGKISGEVFAGLKVGGTVNCKLNWKPTEADAKALSITREFKNLFKVGGGMEAKAGFGGKCEFTLTYNKGRFQVILNAGLTSGLGCEGKIAAEINPDNIDDLFTVLINLMTHSDFKRFAFFDESNDKDETFRKFNDMITVAVTFGLTFGELALLPFTVIDDMEKRSREERNAPFVANFLLNKDNIQKNEAWIKNMPAETLAKLLTVLINYHNIPNETALWGLVGEEKEDRNAVAEHNAVQNKAILQIFEWLGAKDMPNYMQLTRFENAVQRIGLTDPTQIDDGKKWERYAENLLKIKAFFDACVVNKYDDGYILRETKNTYYNMLMVNNNRIFIKMINKLTNRFGLYQIGSSKIHHGHQVGFPRYRASQNGQDIKSQGYEEFNWENTK